MSQVVRVKVIAADKDKLAVYNCSSSYDHHQYHYHVVINHSVYLGGGQLTTDRKPRHWEGWGSNSSSTNQEIPSTGLMVTRTEQEPQQDRVTDPGVLNAQHEGPSCNTWHD